MKEQRVAIVHSWPDFDSIPSLHGAASLLSEHGYLVDIFTPTSRDFASPVFNDRKINLRLSHSEIFFRDLPRKYRSVKTWLSGLGSLFVFLRASWWGALRWHHLLSNLVKAWRLHRSSSYRCVIGVEPEGLWQATWLGRLIQVPVIYYSLELLLSHEVSNGSQKRSKKRETAFSRRARFVIIQDEERARLLANDNDIPMEQFALVPNAPLGPARRSPSDYWHKRFELSSDQRVVFHAGNITKWTRIEEIVDSVRSWPDNWILVIHTPSNAESSEPVKRLRELAIPGRVFFSLQPVTRQEYDTLLDGADIGIAFYMPTDESALTGQNIQTLGLSSGKIAYYLRAGLPVIVNQAGSISELLQRERCGIAVENGRGIGMAISQIAQHYQEYSGRACRVFENYLDFRRGFQEVLRRIDLLGEKT